MTRLVLGVLLWSLMHLIPVAAPGIRQRLAGTVGENPWKGIFALFMVLSLYLIISGWRATTPETLYVPPDWGRHAAMLLVLAGLILFVASTFPVSRIKRLIRHPQLTGVALWGAGHLLANGEARSIVLFGALTAWAVISIALINRRDGPREKPPAAPPKADIAIVAIGLVLYALLAHFHAWFTGVPLFN